VLAASRNVCFRGQTGKHLLPASIFELDPEQTIFAKPIDARDLN
jgi:hypothetical protein